LRLIFALFSIHSNLETKSAAPVPSALPLSDKPVMLSLSKGPLKIGIGTNTHFILEREFT
jgi:hypothetical protein